MVSPSGMPAEDRRWALRAERQRARALAEPELDQHGGERRARDGLAVDAFDAHPPDASGAERVGQRVERWIEPRIVDVDEREQALARALEVDGGLGADEHDLGPRHALGPARLGLAGPLRPP